MKTIDLKDWTLFSARRNSDNYYDKDEKVMLKVFNLTDEKKLIESLEREKKIAELYLNAGIRTPKVGDYGRTTDGRLCMTYENIKGKKSLSRAVSEDNSLAEPYMELFAEAAKQIHSTKCDADWIPGYKDVFKRYWPQAAWVSDGKKAEVLDMLSTLPDGDTILHGDCHPGNFIIANGTVYVIDLNDTSKGWPLYDVSWFYTITITASSRARDEILHWNDELSEKCWKHFAKCYFGDDMPDEHELKVFGKIWKIAHLPMMPPGGPVAPQNDDAF